MLLLLLACSDYDYAEIGYSEVFHQPEVQESADVLFVVDNSCSMAEEQLRLGENFDAFVEVLGDSYADFQIGVVTTDVSEGGQLHGGVFSRDTPALEEAFREAVAVGSSGDRDERGLEGALLALKTNPVFLRDEAHLNLIFLSDEDDHSPAALEIYLDRFADLSADGGLSAHAIVGDQPYGCVSGGTAANAGVRYIEAAKATEGYRDSICADDYHEILSRIGLQVVGWNDTFALARLPEEDSLVVWVDGVVMPQREVDGWSYSPGQNAILFHGRSVPRPGMDVFVEYMPLMGNRVDTGL